MISLQKSIQIILKSEFPRRGGGGGRKYKRVKKYRYGVLRLNDKGVHTTLKYNYSDEQKTLK